MYRTADANQRYKKRRISGESVDLIWWVDIVRTERCKQTLTAFSRFTFELLHVTLYNSRRFSLVFVVLPVGAIQFLALMVVAPNYGHSRTSEVNVRENLASGVGTGFVSVDRSSVSNAITRPKLWLLVTLKWNISLRILVVTPYWRGRMTHSNTCHSFKLHSNENLSHLAGQSF